MKKRIIIFSVILALSSFTIYFVVNQPEHKEINHDIQFKDLDIQAAADIYENTCIDLDLDAINFTKKDESAMKKFNHGLADAMRNELGEKSVNTVDLQRETLQLDQIIMDYCSNHYDAAGAHICEDVLEKFDGNKRGIVISYNDHANNYKKYTSHYKINDNTMLTITPDLIAVDEYADEMIGDTANVDAGSTSWNYKNVAARRTLYIKNTANGKTDSFKVISIHIGGQVKYNGKNAAHSADYHAYYLSENHVGPCNFTVVSKYNEAYAGTSWHYKYVGKVNAAVKTPEPISVQTILRDKLVGCQLITNKDGSVTKNDWPE